MARIRHFPERGPLHRLPKNGIIDRPRPGFSPPPRGARPNLLGSNPAIFESPPSSLRAREEPTATPSLIDFAPLLLDPLADLAHQYMVLERLQNEEVQKATLALVQLRCHEYRSLWSRDHRNALTSMLKLYERLVQEVRTGRRVGRGGIRAGEGEMRDVRREMALGIRKAVRDGVRIARHTGPGPG